MFFKRIIGVLLISIVSNHSFSQFRLNQENYHAFDGRVIPSYSVESKYTVIFIDANILTSEQYSDTVTLKRIVNRVDTLYAFYMNNLGFEPVGGNPNYGNKANVFFGPPSCGAGCGLIGAKGIEVDGFSGIYYNHKYRQNVNRDVIVGYEFGRNFFNFSDKILFPFRPDTEDKNGGFAEAFAALMYQYAFDEVMDDPEERTMNETLMNLKWARTWSRGYINDTSANPYNSFARWELDGVIDPNRGRAGHDLTAYFATTGLFPIFDIFGKERMFPGFFKNIREQPTVATIEDALSNIAFAASKTIQTNMNAFFLNVMKFKLNQQTIDQIAQFPVAPSKLITDENLLYFFSPFDTIPLNLRSTNYLADNCKYLVMSGKDTISFSVNGNNYLDYSILRRRHSIGLQCYLINSSGVKIDSFSTELRKRDKIKLIDKASDMFAYYLTNETVKSYFQDSVLVIEGLANDKSTINRGLVYWSTVNRRDRVLKLEGSIRHVSPVLDNSYPPLDGLPSTGFSFLRYGGPARNNGTSRVGYDVGMGDTLNYYSLNMIDNSTLFVPPPQDTRKYNLINVEFSANGYSAKGYFKDVLLSDVTDTDADGILDFDDDCPTISVHPLKLQVSDTSICINSGAILLNVKPDIGHDLLWYGSDSIDAKPQILNSLILSGGNNQKTLFVSQLNNTNGCEGERTPIKITILPAPQKPSLQINGGDSSQVCSGINSTAMTLSGSVGTIRWQSSLDSLVFTDIANATSSGYTATNLTTTTYYRVIATNSCGSNTSTVIKVLVNPKPVPSFTVNTASQVLTNNSFVFTNTSTGGSTYLWRFGNGATSTTQNATYSYSAAGSYVVRLIVTTAAGCKDSTSTTVTVTTPPPPPPPPAAGNLYVAGATCATFNNGSAGRLAQICYTVAAGRPSRGRPGPIQVSTVTPASFMYYVRVTAPSASFTVNIGQTVSQNGFSLFTVNTGGSQASGDNCVRVASVTTPSTGQARVSITRAIVGRTYIIGVRYDTRSLVGYTTTGTITPVYTFRAMIGNLTLPNSTSSVTAYPNNCANAPAGIISSRMPDSKEINSTTNAPTKALSITNLKLKAYPNPTSYYFNVVVEGGVPQTEGVLRVMNMVGQLIEERKQVRPGQMIQVGHQYINGMYLIEYTQGSDRVTLKVNKH